MYELAKYGLLPGSLALFLAGLSVGLATLCFPRTRRLGVCIIIAFTAGYGLMSMPAGAWLLGRLVSIGYSAPAEPSQLAGIEAVVILDASTERYARDDLEVAVVSRQSAIRALEAIRLYRKIHPRLVVITGGSYEPSGNVAEGTAMRELLVAKGVPANRIVLDTKSRNTREHALNVPPILRAHGVTRIALVTSSVHMRRALRDFSGTGMQIVPAPAPLEPVGKLFWWPNMNALGRSMDAWYEVFGLLRDVLY